MGTSSFSFDPGPIPLARQPYQIVVQRYNAKSSPLDPPATYNFLPNVYCLSITRKEGEPGTARFRYMLSDLFYGSKNYPDGFEDLIGVDSTSPYAVQVDDRLTVSAVSPDTGKFKLLFDGFAQEPEANVTPGGQQVTFSAVGVAIRCWDVPIQGSAYRDADDPDAGTVTQTDLPARFNPTDARRGICKPNATPLGSDVDIDGPFEGGNYPVFLDPQIDLAIEIDEDEEEDEDEADTGDTRRAWTLGMAARYLLWNSTAYGGNASEQYVQNGNVDTLDDQLQAIAPLPGQTTMNPANSDTYVASDIIVRDTDVSNMPWPKALRQLIWPYGFRFRFQLSTDFSGNPATQLQFYRKDGMFGTAPKALKLQPQGAAIDPGQSNASTIHVGRGQVAYNRVRIETDPILYEVSVILSPAFVIAGADATNLAKFDKSTYKNDIAGWQANRRYYRMFVYDECGDGHWDLKAGEWETETGPINLLGFGQVFNPSYRPGSQEYTKRYRPGRTDLISTGSNSPLAPPLQSQLAVSKDYAGTTGTVWDGTGHWQTAAGGWRLLKNRLGIFIDVDNPNKWDIGVPQDSTKDFMGRKGLVNLVERLANPGGSGGLVYLRLTTVIEGDAGIKALADKRDASSTDYEITTRVDARDHFRKYVIDTSSPYNPTSGAKAQQIIPRDDTAKAIAYAQSLRAANELGHWAGSVTIPRMSLAYDVGDRISGVAGRNATFQTNAGGQVGEAPTYPTVTSVTWNFDGQQSTTLELSNVTDEPLEPA